MTEKTSRLLWNAVLFTTKAVLYVMWAGLVFYFGMWHGSDHLVPVEGERVMYVVCEYMPSTNGHAGTEGTRNCHSVDKMRIVHATDSPGTVYRPRSE